MTDLFRELNDATPLDLALRGDLIQTWITTADLKEAEEENIVHGAAWKRRRRAALLPVGPKVDEGAVSYDYGDLICVILW
ncbi:hypothetical protein [Bradyrhizobium australafricanum]|uniref:hypothetical protein n=1 Tax=Bradyrhizobium australafricanum TaxID=2821406 RepID=UPI0035D664BE|nr:hypothetical protein [Bradyrhizobium australafricanum]